MALPWRNTRQQLQKRRRRRKCAIFYFSEVTIEGGVKVNNATLKSCYMHLLLLLWWVQQVRWSWRKKKLLPDCSDCLKKICSFSMPQSFKWKGEKLKQKDFNFFISVISSVFQAVPQISKHAWNRNIENTPPDCISRASDRTLTLERLKRSCISAALFLHKHANRKAQSQPLLKFNQHLLLLEIIHPEA